jgi:K+-transporting ATPase A subunit
MNLATGGVVPKRGGGGTGCMQMLAYRIIPIYFAGLSIGKMPQMKEKIGYRKIVSED